MLENPTSINKKDGLVYILWNASIYNFFGKQNKAGGLYNKIPVLTLKKNILNFDIL